VNFEGLRVLVVGDVMLDNYVACNVGRISPEAPVPVAQVVRRWSVPGGAANVARNLARLGLHVDVVGIVGRDAEGVNLQELLRAQGIGDGLVRSEARRTTAKTRITSQGQQLLRLDEEDGSQLSAKEEAELHERCESPLAACDVLVLSDYAKGVLMRTADDEGLCPWLVCRARSRGVPILVDPKGSDWTRYAGVQCVTPNSGEFAIACGKPGTHIEGDDLVTQGARLCVRYGFDRLLVTRGPKGVVLLEPGKDPCYVRDVSREVADVSGAGDTVMATLAACVAKGLDWETGVRIANAAAGVAVGKLGTAPVTLAELNQALREGAENPRLYTAEELQDRIQEWRRAGETIVFTNGCFDLIHPGHASLIRQCVALGDRLIIGLNSDASVRRLKGPTRPVQDQQSRAQVISAMHGVDAVVIFEEDTPLKLLEKVRPDILVKGADYAQSEVVGGDLVRGYGGRVHLADLTEGCSTTGIVKRLGVREGED
jgi:D-beta-D-heptose 7-phosphate kinase/D-beta-D-heptose 1-phosphate adenosyltransferase